MLKDMRKGLKQVMNTAIHGHNKRSDINANEHLAMELKNHVVAV